jgi:broad specificity phosphatase PhoE
MPSNISATFSRSKLTVDLQRYPVTIFLIRHGEGNHNLSPETIAGRASHALLTERGQQQPERLGRLLAARGLRPTKVFASPAVRTVDTATITLAAGGWDNISVTVQDDLQERSHGVWEGKPRSEAYTPVRLAQIATQQKDFKLPGGESMNEVAARGLRWLNQVAPKPTLEPQLYFVFTHVGFIRNIVGSLSGWDHEQIHDTFVDYATVTILRGSGAEWKPGGLGLNVEKISDLDQTLL